MATRTGCARRLKPLGNAIKFTEHGQVSLTVQRQADSRPHFQIADIRASASPPGSL